MGKNNEDDLDAAMSDLDDMGFDIDDSDVGMDADGASRDLLSHIRDTEFKSNEEATGAVMSEALKAFKASAKNESELFLETCDTEYWFCMCFQNRTQKEEFLRQAGWLKFGDKYLDGVKVAQKMGLKLPEASGRFIEQEREKSLTPSPSGCIDMETAKKSLKQK